MPPGTSPPPGGVFKAAAAGDAQAGQCLLTRMRKALWADLQLQGTCSSFCMASTSMGEAQRQAPRLLCQARLLT